MRSALKAGALAALVAVVALGLFAANVFGGEDGGPDKAVNRVISLPLSKAKEISPPAGATGAAKNAAKKKKIKLSIKYFLFNPVTVAGTPGGQAALNAQSTTTVHMQCPAKYAAMSGGISQPPAPVLEGDSSNVNPDTSTSATVQDWYERGNNTSQTAQIFQTTLVCLKFS